MISLCNQMLAFPRYLSPVPSLLRLLHEKMQMLCQDLGAVDVRKESPLTQGVNIDVFAAGIMLVLT